MTKKISIVVGLMALLLLATHAVQAAGLPWQDHAEPFDFLFGNHFDTHQQALVAKNGQLTGFFYISFTGTVQNGVPVATHANCVEEDAACLAGWVLKGVPVQATVYDKQPHQHPQWCVDAADLPKRPGYSHFHWLGGPEHAGDLVVGDVYDGYLLLLTATETFFFDHHGGFLVTPGLDEVTHANIVTDCP